MFEQSIELLNHPRYLGSFRVVDGLVRDFVASVMAANSEQDVMDACTKTSGIFAGLDSSYIQVSGWANRSNLGRDLERYMNVDGSQSFVDIVRTAFLIFASQLMEALVSAGEAEAAKPRVDELIQNMVSVLMGTAPMTAGSKNAGN